MLRTVRASHASVIAAKVEAVDYPRFQQDYTTLRMLGRGAFGEVWHCQRVADGKEFAVKAVRFRSGGLSKYHEEHALREAQILAMMNHPNILHFYGAWIETPNTACSTVAGTTPSGTSSCPSSPPMNLVAPPPSPAVHSRLPPGKLDQLDPDSGDESECSYGDSMDGTRAGDVVFCEWLEEDEEPVIATAQSSAAPANPAPARTPTGFRAMPPMPLMSPTAGGGTLGYAQAPPPPMFRRQRSSSPSEDELTNFATLYLQVELCRDETLQGWILKRNTQVHAADAAAKECDGEAAAACRPWAKVAIRIFIQCLRALGHIHARDCVHRDVKPSNILFARGDGSCAIRLGDLGLAKVVSDEPSGCPPTPHQAPASDVGTPGHGLLNGAVTPCGGGVGRVRSVVRCETVGTPSYASPEQLAGKPVGAATDVYALGLVLAELLCPVSTQMERATVLEALRSQRELPAVTSAAFPELARIAVSMTNPDPTKRPEARQILRIARQVLRRLRRGTPEGDGKAPQVNKGTAPWQQGAPNHKAAVPGGGVQGACRSRRRLETQQAARKAAGGGKQMQQQSPPPMPSQQQQQQQQAQHRRGLAGLLSLSRPRRRRAAPPNALGAMAALGVNTGRRNPGSSSADVSRTTEGRRRGAAA